MTAMPSALAALAARAAAPVGKCERRLYKRNIGYEQIKVKSGGPKPSIEMPQYVSEKEEPLFFSDWPTLIRIFVITVFGYAGLVLILRLSGTRTLSKMNSFDFIITISLGSCFASAILQKSTALVDALFAFTMLVGLQFLVTWLSVRYPKVNQIVKSDPILLFAEGQFLFRSMKKAHVTEDEVFSAMRQQGFSSSEQVQFVVLETNGSVVAVGK